MSMQTLLRQLANFDITFKACTEQAAAAKTPAPVSAATLGSAGSSAASDGPVAITNGPVDTGREAGTKSVRECTDDELIGARSKTLRAKRNEDDSWSPDI